MSSPTSSIYLEHTMSDKVLATCPHCGSSSTYKVNTAVSGAYNNYALCPQCKKSFTIGVRLGSVEYVKK